MCVTLFLLGLSSLIAQHNLPEIPEIFERPNRSDTHVITALDYIHGNALIRVMNARAKDYDDHDMTPRYCAAMLKVTVDDTEKARLVYPDIMSFGGSYGLFVPRRNPFEKFFIAVMLGNYDGELIIVDKSGNVRSLFGGFFFISEDGRYLVSQYYGDLSALTVFDSKENRIVYQTFRPGENKRGAEKHMLPFWPFQWYYSEEQGYFCSETTWKDGGGWPLEGSTALHLFDLATGTFRRIPFSAELVTDSKKVAWYFDARDYKDCTCNAAHEDRVVEE